MVEGLKAINDYNIYKEGSWCEVTDWEGKDIYSGSVDENLTHEDIFHILTNRIEFKLNGRILLNYNEFNSFPGEYDSTLKLLAAENNCSIEDIETYRVKYPIEINEGY